MNTTQVYVTVPMLCPEHGPSHSGRYLAVDSTWCDECEKSS